MGFWSSLSDFGSSAVDFLGNSSGGLLGFGADLGWADNASLDSQHKDQTERAYTFAQRYAENTPSWSVSGLRKAGLNPILAAGGGFSSQLGQSISMSGHGANGGNWDIFSKNKENKLLSEKADTEDSIQDKNNAEAALARVTARATKANAESNRISAEAAARNSRVSQYNAVTQRAKAEEDIRFSRDDKLYQSFWGGLRGTFTRDIPDALLGIPGMQYFMESKTPKDSAIDSNSTYRPEYGEPGVYLQNNPSSGFKYDFNESKVLPVFGNPDFGKSSSVRPSLKKQHIHDKATSEYGYKHLGNGYYRVDR